MILNEALPQISADLIDRWKVADDDERSNLLPEIFSALGNPDLDVWADKLQRNFDIFGIDPSDNPMMNVLANLEFTPNVRYEDNINKLTDMQERREANLPKDFYELESLYDRSEKDFEYTVKALELLDNRQELSKYYKDITDITIDKFMTSNGEIKPAGIGEKNNEDTIFGTFEQFAIDNELDNEADKLKYSAKDVLTRFGLSESSMFAALAKLFAKYGSQAGIKNANKYAQYLIQFENIYDKTKYAGSKNSEYSKQEATKLRNVATKILNTKITNVLGDKVDLVIQVEKLLQNIAKNKL